MNDDLYRPRRDVSGVRPQGGYAAKRCPLRVYYDLFPPPGAVPLVEDAVDRLRMDAGNTFEARVFELIRQQHVGVTDLSAERNARSQTVEAMRIGAIVILGGELPLDPIGRRVGRPDVLVRAEQRGDGTWAYHPIDVKHHQTLTALSPRGDSATVGSFAALQFSAAARNPELQTRTSATISDDLLQLSHYHRMLEACGHDSSLRFGGIIGSEQVVVWHPLDTPMGKPRWEGLSAESQLQRYDFEFSFRLDVLAAGAAGQQIVDSVNTSECAKCPWKSLCVPRMRAQDCVSLLPSQGYQSWRMMRSEGVSTRAAVARLDHATATTLAGIGTSAVRKMAKLLNDPTERANTDDLAPLIGRSTQAIEAGLNTVGDLRRLDPVVVKLSAGVGKLPELIDHARVVTHGQNMAHRRRGVDAVAVPQFDVEIDIDMENALNQEVYLWGAFDGVDVHSFVSWTPPSELMEATVFAEFWDWFTNRRNEATQSGKTFGAFCWYQAAETTALRRGAAAAASLLGMRNAPSEVEAFCNSGSLIDLLQVFKTHYITGGGNSLKLIAPLAGFGWDDHDAGGENSMAWHHQALHEPDESVRSTLRERLVRYNRDDVHATDVVRRWMRATTFPSVESLPS